MSGRARGTAILALLLLSVCAAALAPAGAGAAVPNPNPGLIARWEPCEPDTGVTVIVDRNSLADGKIYVGCALGPQPNGVAALQNAGFALEGTAQYGLGFICRIDGQPTLAEESCAQTPGGDRWWSYWHGKPGGRWGFSGVGAANPLSGAGVNAVQGWGFGTGPRIEPMDATGPSAFELPPAQDSSTGPASLARRWLTQTLVRTVELELVPGSGVSHLTADTLAETLALSRAGVTPAALAPVSDLLDNRVGSGADERSPLQSWANPSGDGFGIDPSSPEYPLYGLADRYATAILAIAALGGDPTDFAGVDFRGALIAKVDAASGKILGRAGSGPVTKSADVGDLASTVQALASTGPFPAKALSTLDLLLAALNGAPTGSLGTVRALVAARDGVGLAGLGPARFAAVQTALDEAGEYLEGIQGSDGGVSRGSAASFASTSAGAAVLALTGRREAARKAARWVSRYQVTAEYAGTPDPVSGEPAPAEALIGAFLPSEEALRNAIAYGISSEGLHGPYNEAQVPTAEALEALSAAGPYGPLYATLDQGSLWFDSQLVGSTSAPQAATLTNQDPRPLAIAEASLAGAQAGDFQLAGGDCVGHVLREGESCEFSARFTPRAAGLRETSAQLSLEASDQTLQLALGGTAVAAGGGTGGAPLVQPSPPVQQPAPASLRVLGGRRQVGANRVAKIAVLGCPAGALTCTVRVPKRVQVRIGRRSYPVRVLAPASLAAGGSGALRVRLGRPGAKALAGRGALVRVRVRIDVGPVTAVRVVRARIGGSG